MSSIPALPFAVDTSPSVAVDASRLKTEKNLDAAGARFEAIFTGMMLKAMRSTHLAEDLFGSKAQDQFRDMWDQKTAESMAAHAPLGIGKAMTEFLSRAQPTLAADTPADPGKADLNHDPPEAAA
ncbi:MAG: rod-binding protein [Pseudomonadota bacterium]